MLESQGDDPASRGEDHAAIKALWRLILCPSCPDSAEPVCETAMMLSSSEYEDLTVPILRNLDDKMGTGPKSIQSQAAARLYSGQSERAITHYSSTQEWGGFCI